MNSVLGGATVALLCALVVVLPITASAVIGALAGVILLALSLWYEYWRLNPLISGLGSAMQDEQELA